MLTTHTLQQQLIIKELFDAISKDDLDKIKLLALPEHLTIKNQNKKTLIRQAASEYKTKRWIIVEHFLALYENLPISHRNNHHDNMQLGSVLLYAVEDSNLSMSYKQRLVLRLLRHGAHTDCYFTPNNETALHIAAKQGEKTLLRMLLNAGADINAKTLNQQIPLQFALDKNHEECVRLLIHFEVEQALSFFIMILNLLSSNNNNSFNQLPLEINIKILNAIDDNRSFIISTLIKNIEDINHSLALIKYQCALDAYEKKSFIKIPIDMPMPIFMRSQQSVTFFKKLKNTLADNQKSKSHKLTALKKLSTEFTKNATNVNSNAIQIITKYSLNV